jgi:very-short-patch-repair endonuclease
MTLHYNRHAEREKRRDLRNHATAAEQQLWQVLRGSQVGAKFRRQHSVDAFVLDFYAPRCKLAIEVDGDSHYTEGAPEYDHERTTHLKGFGIRVLRFTNTEVFENLEGVVAVIEAAVRESNHPLAPSLVRRGKPAVTTHAADHRTRRKPQ